MTETSSYPSSTALQADAQALSSALPPLMAEAERLAASVLLGDHGRRRAGMGETFWQYRRAESGDDFAAIDWRRSARSDRLYIRQTEWEVAQAVSLWVDPSKAMGFRSDKAPSSKADRAKLLALATSVALNRGGERFALLGSTADRPRRGKHQVEQIGAALVSAQGDDEYGAVPFSVLQTGSRAAFFSDFLGPRDALISQVSDAANKGVRGCLVQILDPAEEAFPFDGRTIFRSMGGTLQYETDRARSLKDAYLDKLAARKDELAALASRTGWHYTCHRTDETARAAMLWIYGALEGFRT